MEEYELRDVCVICVASTLSTALHATVFIPKEEARLVECNSNGEYLHLDLKSGDQPIHHIIAGQPHLFVLLARALGNKPGIKWWFNMRPVGVWAQLEWFGLRICARHCYEAQELWKAGGNRHWSR